MIYVFVGLSLLYFGLSFILTANNASTLLSGYNTLSPEEQEKIDIVPIVQFFKKFHRYLGASHLLFGGSIYYWLGGEWLTYFISFYPLMAYGYFLVRVRDLSKWQSQKSTTAGIVVLTLVGLLIAILFLIGNEKNEWVDLGDRIEITGMYGLEFDKEDLVDISLRDTLPGIRVRLNGFSSGDVHKGYYKTIDGEKVRLLIDGNESPYLYIKIKGQVPIYFRPKGGLIVNEQLNELISDK